MKKDFIILGGGISGMMAALEAARNGFSSYIIEKNDSSAKSFIDDYRSTSFTPLSIEFLKSIGIWNDIEKVSGIIKDIYVLDNKSDDQINFSAPSSVVLGVMVKNRDLKQILIKKIKDTLSVCMLDNETYSEISETDEDVSVSLSSGRRLEAKFLIFCGARPDPKIFPTEIDKYYKQHALTFDIEHEICHDSCAVEHFMDFAVLAILPLHSQNHSSIVLSIDEKYANLLCAISESEFLDYMKDKIGPFLGDIKLVPSQSYINPDPHAKFSISRFPLYARISNKYVSGKKILMASSAHQIHPLAGQGLNQSIKDIAEFFALESKYSIGADMLAMYQRNRMRDNYKMFLVTDGLNTIFSDYGSVAGMIRSKGFRIINNSGFIKDRLVKHASGGIN